MQIIKQGIYENTGEAGKNKREQETVRIMIPGYGTGKEAGQSDENKKQRDESK